MDPLVEALASLTGPAVLAFVLVLLLRGDLTTRSTVRTLEAERDAWRKLAAEAIDLGFAALRSDGGEG